jgi:hypothetical protein
VKVRRGEENRRGINRRGRPGGKEVGKGGERQEKGSGKRGGIPGGKEVQKGSEKGGGRPGERKWERGDRDQEKGSEKGETETRRKEVGTGRQRPGGNDVGKRRQRPGGKEVGKTAAASSVSPTPV